MHKFWTLIESEIKTRTLKINQKPESIEMISKNVTIFIVINLKEKQWETV